MDTVCISVKDAERIKETLKVAAAAVLIMCIILGYTYYYGNSLSFNVWTACEKNCEKLQYAMGDCVPKCYAYYTDTKYQEDGAFAPPPPQ